MSNNKKIKKNLTYEQIGNKLSISPQQVHKIEKEAINKIISRLSNLKEYNIFEIVLSVSEKFGVEPGQIYNKLDDKNKNKVLKYVSENYGKNIELFNVDDDYDRDEDLFE